MKNQKYRQWCNRKALLAGVLAVSMAVTPMTTAFAGTGTQTAIALQDAKETSDEVVLADFDFNEAGDDGSFSGGNAIATVGGGSIELVDHDGGKAAKFVASDKDWMQVRAADGSSLLKGHDEVTISYDILPEMSNSHWVFYAAENGNSLNWNDNGNKERYLGVLVKNGTTEIQTCKSDHQNGSFPMAACGHCIHKRCDGCLPQRCACQQSGKQLQSDRYPG